MAMRSPARSPTAGRRVFSVARLRAEHDGQWRIDIGLAWREHAERHAAPAIVAAGALEPRQLRGLDAGHHQRVLGQGIAADQRAAAIREQGVGFQRRARILIELAFEPLDLEWPAELRPPPPAPAPRRSRCPARHGDAPKAAAGPRRGRLSNIVSGALPSELPSPSTAPPQRMPPASFSWISPARDKGPKRAISSSLRRSPQGGILLFLPSFTVVTKRSLSSGNWRRSGATVPPLTMLGPWQCEHFCAKVILP